MQAAKLIRQVTPLYPTLAKQARVSGTVYLEAIIDRTGAIESLRVKSGSGLLAPAAVDAVRQWRAPGAGSIHITGNAYDSDTSCGDGVIVSIKQGAQVLWQQTIENGNSTGFSYDVKTTVVAGDQINFVINQRSNTYFDNTSLIRP